MLELFLAVLLPCQPVRWVETTHADFADGVVDPEMYVSLRAAREPDSGCVEFFSRFDVDNNGYYDLACSDDSGPNLTLYMGSSSGYSPGYRLIYPVTSGGNEDMADLNLDGHSELIQSGWRMGHTIIYWGTPDGPSPTDTTELDYSGQGEDVNVYDLDKDAYLDIILGSSDGNLYIFWGSPSGYSSANCTQIYLGYSLGHNIEIADFDRDGWGDIALSTWTFDQDPIIYWGPNRTPRETVWLPGRWNNFHGISVADLDKNGWLDIVYTGYDTVVTSYVYFGSDSGFRADCRTEIHPGQCYGGSAIMDFNDDSWLDIVYLRGNWINGGMWKPNIYLNTLSGPRFSDANRIELGEHDYNASGGFIADFNYDGIQDIFVNNMMPHDSSYVLWGPDYVRRTGLPAHNDHHGVFREPGNVYDRSLTAFYTSSVFDAGPESCAVNGISSWVAFEPPLSHVSVSFHTGNTPEPDSTWTEFGTVNASGGPIPGSCLGGRYMQYRVTFSYQRPCYLPYLEKIVNDLTIGPEAAYDVGVEAILAPADTVDSGVTLIPQARVHNYGNCPATFRVTFRIGGIYSDSRPLSLDAGATITAAFAPWVPTTRGEYAAMCTTAYARDTNPANDWVEKTVAVRVRDVGAVQILAPPGVMQAGDTVTPAAVVRNYGTTTETFDAVFRIGGYSDSTPVQGLAPDSERTVSFRTWTATVGAFVVTCSTMLATDMNQPNDKVTASVLVNPVPHVDVGVEQIVAPAGILDSGAVVVPAALVRNYGDQPATFPVRFYLGGFYTDECTLALAASAAETVRFAPWSALQRGTHVVRCTTACANDTNPANDRRTAMVAVRVCDVGAVQIIAPRGVMQVGDTVSPCAVVRNWGTEVEGFAAVCRIGVGYQDTVAVSGLAPDSERTLCFRTWTAGAGTHVVSCSTTLAPDMNHANDKAKDSVLVAAAPFFDVGVEQIIAPAGILDSGTTVSPVAVIRNYGDRTATFPARFYVGGFYADERTLTLAAAGTDTVTFGPWSALQRGTHVVRCTTACDNDTNPANNMRSGTATVRVRDAAAVQVLAPRGVMQVGDTVTPRAVVRNCGTVTENFSAVCRVGSDYADSVSVAGLRPDSERTVAFRPWTALAGTHAVSCSTMLALDMNPANDKAVDSVRGTLEAVYDVGCEAILSPPGIVDSGEAVMPAAVVRNYGTQTATFPVRFYIGDFYFAESIVSVRNGVSDTVRFPVWPAVERGTHAVKCTTACASDSNPANDVVYATTDVQVHDVGAVRIVAPFRQVAGGDTVIPQAVVTNFGDAAETFPVLFRIGLVYADTASVTALPPDSSVNVRFARWPSVPGDYAICCSTMLDADMNHPNDRVDDSVHVAIRSLVVEPDTQASTYPALYVDYRLRVVNLGSGPDTIDLWTTAAPPGWTTYLLDATKQNELPDHNNNGIPDVAGLDPGGTAEFVVRVTAPADGLAGAADTTVVTGRSARDTLMTDDARLRTDVLAVSALRISPDQYDSVAAGGFREYLFKVDNMGNLNDMADLEVRRISSGYGWTYELLDASGNLLSDGNHNGRPDVGPMQPFDGTCQLLLRVAAPENAPVGQIDTVELWASSGADPGVRSYVTVRTRALGMLTALIVAPDQQDQQMSGSSETYRLYVKTTGNATDCVSLAAGANQTDWDVSLWDAGAGSRLPENGEQRAELTPVFAGVQKFFTILVKAPDNIPDDLSGNIDSLGKCYITVVGQSGLNPLLLDTAIVTIQAVPRLAIHNYQNPFRDRTRFIFSVPQTGRVNLYVYNRAGEIVSKPIDHEEYQIGIYARPWNATNLNGRRLAPGTYLYTLELTDTKDRLERRLVKKLMIR